MISSDLQIGTLRLRGVQEEGPAVRLRLAQLLNTAELHPAGLAPAAVLVVRRLADPLPGRLAPARHMLRVDPAWETAVRCALDDLCRHAARPQQGIILGDPDAVLFADEAEMLACLLVAWRRGQSSWWQRALSRVPGAAGGPVLLLAQRTTMLPAAVRCLADWGEAVPVVERLSPAQAQGLLRAVMSAYDLPELAPAASGEPDPTPSPKQSPTGNVPIPSGSATPPWAEWLPAAVPPALKPEQALLLGVCLALHARPAAVRTPAFRRQLLRWQQDIVRSFPRRPSAAEPAVPPLTASPPLDTPAPMKSMPEHPPGTEEAGRLRPGERARAQTPAAVHERDAPLGPASTGAGAPPQAGPPAPHEPDGGRLMPAAAGLAPFEGMAAGAATEAGGVFYLVNLMRVLALPTCCEPGWGLASQVSAWGILELLARALLEPAEAADPLWRVLAELDGRQPETLPGAGYRRTGDGALPAGWDSQARVGPAWTPDDSPLLRGLNPELQDWLALVMPFICRRLQQALRLAHAGDIRPALLLVPGRLFVTRSHVDLVMGLEAISLPVRRAGLDANPGWLPAFGRVITFHFR